MGIESEETNEENIDLQAIADGENKNEATKQIEEVQFTELEQSAVDQGWSPESDFKGKEGNWKTAKEFINDGKFISQINSLKQQMDSQKLEFDSRLDNSNKLHEVRKQAEIKKLKSEQRDAVGMADSDVYDEKQKLIDELEGQKPEVTPTKEAKDPVIAAWESKNPWINDANDEKAVITQSIWNSYLQKNPTATNQQALTHVDTRLSALYPTDNTNPRRNQPNTTENKQKPAKRSGKTLTMADLSNDERNEWNTYGATIFKTEAAFLKAVTDTRTK